MWLKYWNVLIFMFGILVQLTSSIPIKQWTEFLVEEDMFLNADQKKFIYTKRRIKPRAAVNLIQFYWIKGVVPYMIDIGFIPDEIAIINKAMSHIEFGSCIRFEEITSSYGDDPPNILKVKKGPTCASWVGRQQFDSTLTVNKDCLSMGTIAHELMHTLGFFHQQGSPERDNYVIILKENIANNSLSQFEKYAAQFIDDFDVPYDYGSIMHYSQFAFSKNGQPTILPIEADVEIGQRRGLSDGDYIKINRMYECVDYL